MVLSTKQLIEHWKNFRWTRTPKEAHIHHTWKPDHSDFAGNNHQRLQNNMKNYHVNTRGWSDIGQHLTLFPDGKWLIGRDWNRNPASIKGRNHLGFAIEMIGNFDKGHDKLAGKQLEAIVEFLRFINLPIVFHREYAPKTCPGSGISKNEFDKLINKKILKLNMFGKDVELYDYVFQNNKNYISLRELFEKMDCIVDYENTTKQIYIRHKA